MEDKNIQGRKIGYIDEGVVIDHIPTGIVWKVARILEVDSKIKGVVSLGDNYDSKKLSRKGFLKIEGKILSEYEINLVALFAPEATISVIKGGKVESKKKASIPEILKNIVFCGNSNCISNDKEEKIEPLLYHKENKFKCHYCEHEFSRAQLRIKGS